VATKTGHSDPEAYAREVVASDFEEAGDEDVFRKVFADITAGSATVSEDEVRAKMAELAAVARDQVLNEA